MKLRELLGVMRITQKICIVNVESPNTSFKDMVKVLDNLDNEVLDVATSTYNNEDILNITVESKNKEVNNNGNKEEG